MQFLLKESPWLALYP